MRFTAFFAVIGFALGTVTATHNHLEDDYTCNHRPNNNVRYIYNYLYVHKYYR